MFKYIMKLIYMTWFSHQKKAVEENKLKYISYEWLWVINSY